jgi:hypothetical protein
MLVFTSYKTGLVRPYFLREAVRSQKGPNLVVMRNKVSIGLRLRLKRDRETSGLCSKLFLSDSQVPVPA